ncbi:MAG: hypothetical protein ABR975_00570 [Vulcanimicrobiaceae bacterium]|jgi:hypothetical protein
MVRWIDGLVGGLVAGVVTMVFFTVVAVAWLGETTINDFFAQPARLFPQLRGAAPSVALTLVGIVLYLGLSVLLGAVYGRLAGTRPSMRRLPTSLFWGTLYGIGVWLLVHDVFVPWTGVVDVEPLWEGLVGCVLFGLVLSEMVAVAGRRAALVAQELGLPSGVIG